MDGRRLVRQIREETHGCVGAAVGTLDGRAYCGEGTLAELEVPLRELARARHASHQATGGLPGDSDELLTSASRSHLLVRVHHPARRFVAVMLHATGDVAHLRLRMPAYLELAAA